MLNGNFIRGSALGRLALGLIVGAIAVLNFSVASAQSYLLQPGDIVELTVQEDPNLNRRSMVRPDGKVSFPLAGTLAAAGRSPESLQQAVASRLSASFTTSPTVTVSLVALAPKDVKPPKVEKEIQLSVFVLGEVGSPGQFQYDKDRTMNALQALAMAGGPNEFAAKERIQIRRVVNGVENVQIFDYEAIEDGEAPISEIILADGDVIVVPERGLFE